MPTRRPVLEVDRSLDPKTYIAPDSALCADRSPGVASCAAPYIPGPGPRCSQEVLIRALGQTPPACSIQVSRSVLRTAPARAWLRM